MKKGTLLAVAAALLLVPSAWATITISANQPSQTVAAGGTFNVTFSLTVTQSSNPANVAGIDLFLEALQSQNSINISNLFSIQSQTVLIPNWAPAGPGDYPDAVTTANSTHSGYVQNKEDQALSANGASSVLTAPISTLSFETLTLSVSSSIAPGTYTFYTTTPSSTMDPRGTHIVNSAGAYFIPDVKASFNITVVPEPSVACLVLLSVGMLGLVLHRNRCRIIR